MKTAVNNSVLRLLNHATGFAALLCLLVAAQAQAATVEARLPSGIAVSAEFHKGIPSLPAVLVLHGFLQTGHSPPMSTLGGNLSSKGYTVLSPTLSLGLNRRSQSMACEAMHTHTVDDDVAEIAYWVNWLKSKGYKNIVSIGFSSTGNFETLLYNAQDTQANIRKSILVSMNPIYVETADRQKTHGALKPVKNSAALKPALFSLGYCKSNFAATSHSYQSYAQYSESRLLELLRQSRVPLEVILGSQDSILPANWAATLRAMQMPLRVTIIANANHFFDGTSEFDLAEEVENILKDLALK